MEKKISMKTIYLLLVISIGLIGLAVGSTFAVFTASAEINNPISFSSNLNYTSDVFDAIDVTIPAHETKVVNFAVWNSDYVDDANYAAWYIYDGNTSDVSFSIDITSAGSAIPTGVLPTEDPPGAGIYITVVNNTAKKITLTMGVSTSTDDIVLPSYMHLIPNNPGYTLNLTKGTGVSAIYYTVDGAIEYAESTKSVSITARSEYSYYGVPSSGYTISSCTFEHPCGDTVDSTLYGKYENKTLSATSGGSTTTYNLTLTKGTGISNIYYKVNGASSYISTTSSTTISVNSGTTYYYYGVPSTGYTLSSCTASSPCSGTMNGAVSKTLTATANSYNLTLTKGTGISTIYYKVNGASSYTSTTSSKTISVKYGTTYYYYGVASTGYKLSSCTSSSPCSGTMGTSAVSKTLTATSSSTSSYTVTIMRKLGTNTATQLASTTVSSGNSYSYTFTTPVAASSISYNYSSVSCTNGQTATVANAISSGDLVIQATTISKKLTISSVTASTVCTLNFIATNSGTVVS